LSLVIGIKENDRVVLASDSQVTIGGVKKTSLLRDNYKIWHPGNHKEVLIGSVGTVRQMNVVRYMDDIIEELKILKNEVNMSYVVNKVVKKMLSTLKDNNIISSKDNVLAMDNSYLLAVRDKLFQIFSDGAVIEIDEYTAIGSGSNEALATLNTSREMNVIEKIRIAMDATVMNDVYVNYPIIISDTKRDDFTVITQSEHKKRK